MIFKTFAIMCVVFISLLMFFGCSNATVRNAYDKEGAISEFQGEGSYYHSRIIITTPNNEVVIIPEDIEEDQSHPFRGNSPYPLPHRQHHRPQYITDPIPLPRDIH